jgi:hypothetical protein
VFRPRLVGILGSVKKAMMMVIRKVVLLNIFVLANLFSSEKINLKKDFEEYAKVVNDYDKVCRDSIDRLRDLQEKAKIVEAWKKDLHLSDNATVEVLVNALTQVVADRNTVDIYMAYKDWRNSIFALNSFATPWQLISGFDLVEKQLRQFKEYLEEYRRTFALLKTKIETIANKVDEPLFNDLKQFVNTNTTLILIEIAALSRATTKFAISGGAKKIIKVNNGISTDADNQPFEAEFKRVIESRASAMETE